MHQSCLSQEEKRRKIEDLKTGPKPMSDLTFRGCHSPELTPDIKQISEQADASLDDDFDQCERKIQKGDIEEQSPMGNGNRATHFTKTNVDKTLSEKEKVFKILAGLKYEKLKGTHREFTAVDLKRTYLTSPTYKQITIQEVYWVLDAVHAAKRLHRRSEKNPKNGKTTFWYKLPN